LVQFCQYATAFWNTTDSFAGGEGTVAVTGASRAYGVVLDGALQVEIRKKLLRQPDVRLLLTSS
jgi:hypothetical protein